MSFNATTNFPIDFIEFDVQGIVFEKRITKLCLSEFLAYGPQREGGKDGKVPVRKTKDGKIVQWEVEQDDPLCTLEEAFLKVEPSLGFNIELKFDDHILYDQDYLAHVLKAILKVVFDHAKDRPIIFSTFQPDAASLVKKLQSTYLVTNDDCLVIFHDYFILSQENKRITELCLFELLAYGPQREGQKDGKVLDRKTKDGKIVQWEVEKDDPRCTLEEAFLKVEPSLGFKIELKFDDHILYDQDYLAHVLKAILKVKL
ncbi:hypothetical protein TanjilG_25090 [Lupinus angustifolius]|uniref:glycerophosphodiester phosphodiesterase n=1 Tax=Lupinus angustifolius TaxID=3871 RepID=A0A394DCB9_LUPAN|nr:hypothetical protein TanjilG_25090 [Lupinus angustifolius]